MSTTWTSAGAALDPPVAASARRSIRSGNVGPLQEAQPSPGAMTSRPRSTAVGASGETDAAAAGAAAVVATILTPVLMPGVPVIVAAFVAIVVGWFNWLGTPDEPGEWDEPADVAEREGLP